MVDDDGRAAPDDCESRAHTFHSIQDALDRARPGDRISVCPGRYPEALRIGPSANDVYLATEFSFQAVLVPPPTDHRPAVDIQNVSRFEMRGFRIRPSGRTGPVTIGSMGIPGTTVCSPAPVAIRIHDSSDVFIRGDKIGTGPACGYRVGVDVGRSRAALIADTIADFLGRGVAAGPASDLVIAKSDIRFLHDARDQALPGSTLDPEAVGVILDSVNRATLRTVSVFTRRPHDADDLPALLWAGIVIQDARGPVTIRGDSQVTRTWRYGIGVFRSDRVSILNTLVQFGLGDGYLIDDSTGARIIGDDSRDNVTGIRLGPATAGVLVDHLRATRSGVIDCVDGSTGNATGGTANTWRHASGLSSEPSGICVPPG